MAEITTEHGKVGVESIRLKRGLDLNFRLWIDRGRGKYGALELNYSELQRLRKMIGGVLGGAQPKPPRSKSASVHQSP